MKGGEVGRTDVLLIGGGAASVRCARTLRRAGFSGTITLVGDEPDPPYNRPPLSKELLRDDLPDELVHAEPTRWYERQGVRLLTGRRVVALDTEGRVAVLDGGERLRWGRCLLATGASARELPLPGGENVLTLRSLPDARALRAAAVKAGPGATAAIVGGGLLGIELASALVAMGLRPVLLVRDGPLWGGALGEALSAWATARLHEAGVKIRSVAATAVEGDRIATDGGDLRADLVVACIGAEPRTELAEASGMTVDDGIVVDGDGRTGVDGVWAAGDVARVGARRTEHWHHARESGERAARSMLGEELRPPRARWAFTEVAGIPVDVVGDGIGAEGETWVRPRSTLARTAGDRVVQVALVGGNAAVETARELARRGASVRELEETLPS